MEYRVISKLSPSEIAVLQMKKVEEVEKFLEEDCTKEDGAIATYTMMYIAYRHYCERKNIYVITKESLWHHIHMLGYETVVIDGKAHWRDIKVNTVTII